MTFRFEKLTIKAQEAVSQRSELWRREAGQSADRGPASAGGLAGRNRRHRPSVAGEDRSQPRPAAEHGRIRAGRLPESLRRRGAAGRTEPEPGAARCAGRSRSDEGRVRLDRTSAAGADQGQVARPKSAAAERRARKGSAGVALQRVRGSARVTDDSPEAKFQALEKYGIDLVERANAGQTRSGDRSRHRNSPRDSGALATHEEQSRVDRRTGCRQDGHRRRTGPADRARRCAAEPEEQTRHRAGHGRPDRRHQVSRRIRRTPEGGVARSRRRQAVPSCCSSTNCTRSSARGERKEVRMPRTCSSRRWRAANCVASAPRRWTSTASTSKKTRRWNVASSRSTSANRSSKTRSRSCAD